VESHDCTESGRFSIITPSLEHSNMLDAVHYTAVKPITHSIYLVCNIVHLLHEGPGTCSHSAGALL